MIPTGSREYHKAVNLELDRLAESLADIHHGDTAYLARLEATDPGQHAQLAAMPARIQAAVGVAPFPVICAMTNFLLASHRLVFECWAAREQVGLEILARLTATGRVM